MLDADDDRPHLPALSERSRPPSLSSRRDEDASRYASLLVSSIRLYHEEDVIMGRSASDLASRLGGAIAEARAAYLRRFDEERIFYREVVRILAAGDPSKLGPSDLV